MTTQATIRVDAMMEHVRMLSEHYPHRHTGEEDERGAVDYIATVLRDYGLKPRLHELSVMGWELTGEPRLTLLAPEQRQITCVPFIFSGSTPAEGLRGRLQYVGPTLVVGIAPPWQKYAIIDEQGQQRAYVVGRPMGPAVTQSGPPAGFAGTQDGPHYTWPACVIGNDDLQRIESWRASGHEIVVSLVIQSRYKPGCTSYVVEADLAGTETPHEMVVVGAHHDSQGACGFPDRFDSPGGCDNGSGVGAVLELAHYYAQVGYPKTLRFCTYGGEEWNLSGSRHYVRGLVETGAAQRIVAAINCDQTANGETLKVFASTGRCAVAPQYDMEAIAREAVADLRLAERYEIEVHAPPTPGSDHWPYYEAGVPVFMAAWDPIPFYHSSGDTAAACNRPDKYEASVAVTQAVLERLTMYHLQDGG